MNAAPASETAPTAVPLTATWLGRAGLLPFLGLSVAIAADTRHRDFWAQALAIYSLGIICFLLGAWWGLALVRRYPAALVYSNALFLVAFFSYMSLNLQAFFLLSALLFPALLLIERRHALFRLQPAYYARLRFYLSLTASASLLVSAVLAS